MQLPIEFAKWVSAYSKPTKRTTATALKPSMLPFVLIYQSSQEEWTVFLNGPSPASFSFIFGLFQTNINTIFTTNQCEKCLSSVRCWDLNPRPSEHESPLMSGLPSRMCDCCIRLLTLLAREPIGTGVPDVSHN